MYSTKSYEITKAEFNYLLPVLRKKLHSSNDRHYLINSSDDLEDALNRLKGLYDNYDLLNAMTVYKCFKMGSIESFRQWLQRK